MGVKFDDIPHNLKMMVEIIGMEKFIELLRLYGGDTIYIPMYKTVMARDRNRKINKEYNGTNARELGKKYNLTTKQIKNVIKR